MRIFLVLSAIIFTYSVQAAELTGTLKKIADSGQVTIGHRDASFPFSFYDEQKRAAGFSMDICANVVENIKKQLNKPDLEVKYWPVASQARIPLLLGGTVDLECGTTTITLGRLAQVEFSTPFFVTGTRFLVRKNSGIKDLKDLANKRVTVVQGTTNERFIQALIAERNIPNVRIVQTRDAAEAILTFETRRSDVLYSEEVVLNGLASKSRQKNEFTVVGDFLTVDTYGLMMRRNDADFRLLVNRTLSEMYKRGDMEKLYKKWLEPIGFSMTDLARASYKLGAIDE